MRKSRTEPQVHKLQKSNLMLNVEMSPTTSMSPSTRATPLSDFKEVTPLGFTRQKLNFDEDDEESEKKSKRIDLNRNLSTEEYFSRGVR